MIQLLVLLSVIFTQARAINSVDGYTFLSKDQATFSDMGKSESFKGYFKNEDGTTVIELYELNIKNSLKVNPQLCKKISEELLNTPSRLKIRMDTGHTGPVCFIEFFNNIKKRTPAHYWGIIGFIRTQPYLILFNESHPPTSEDQQKAMGFWKTLR